MTRRLGLCESLGHHIDIHDLTLKPQHEYVEAQKVILEPSQSLLGQPKSVEEIVDYIDADIVEA